MRENWYQTTLGKICDKSFNIKWQDHLNKKFEYIDLSSVSRKKLTITETTTINSQNAPSRAKKIVLQNDVIFATTRPTLRRATIINKNYHNQICSTGYAVLRPNKTIVDEGYIYYFLLSDGFMQRMENLQRGASYPAVSDKDVFQTSLLLPKSLEEQKQIVAILDKAFTAIDQAKANIEKNIENAKELFQSKLNDIFSQKGDGWEEKTLGELGKVSMCKRILKKQTTPDGEIPFYKIGTFGKEPNAFISKEIYDEFRSKYSFPKKGDILLSASGTIGRRVIYNGEPAYFQDSNIVWIDNNEELVTNEYLYQFYGVCNFNPSKGATISRLYNDDLRKIKISFPSIEEQKVIIPKMIKLSNKTLQIESNYKQKIEDLEELKKSILQKAFAGELTQKEVVV